MLTLSNVSKRFDETQALTPTTLHIARAQTTVLIGPSGCGKSTMLRLMVGLVSADTGTIAIDGIELRKATLSTLRHRIGYVIQEGGLFPHLNVRRNVTLLAEHLDWPAGKINARFDELLALVKLSEHLANRFPAELSGGQRQRVSLMRALMLDPDVLLLDEPLGALDPMIRIELQQELKGIFKRLGKTVVLVTHDMAEATFLGQTIVLMRDGKIIQQGPFAALANQPADPFVEAFINTQRAPLLRLSEALK